MGASKLVGRLGNRSLDGVFATAGPRSRAPGLSRGETGDASGAGVAARRAGVAAVSVPFRGLLPVRMEGTAGLGERTGGSSRAVDEIDRSGMERSGAAGRACSGDEWRWPTSPAPPGSTALAVSVKRPKTLWRHHQQDLSQPLVGVPHVRQRAGGAAPRRSSAMGPMIAPNANQIGRERPSPAALLAAARPNATT